MAEATKYIFQRHYQKTTLLKFARKTYPSSFFPERELPSLKVKLFRIVVVYLDSLYQYIRSGTLSNDNLRFKSIRRQLSQELTFDVKT